MASYMIATVAWLTVLYSVSALVTAPSAGGSANLQPQRSQQITSRITLQPEVNQTLLICNAYAFRDPVNVVRVRGREMVTRAPIEYKNCDDLTVGLQEGDQLDFKAGERNIGTFFATGLPKRPTKLLLVPHRRDNTTMSVAFESHAFSDIESAQIAVVDAYKGEKTGKVKIRDHKIEENKGTQERKLREQSNKDEPKRVENLKFNSVVALQPGHYEVLLSSDAENKANSLLAVAGQTKYVVMRVGNQDGSQDADQAYPQELIVFPQSAASLVRPLILTFLLAVTVSLS